MNKNPLTALVHIELTEHGPQHVEVNGDPAGRLLALLYYAASSPMFAKDLRAAVKFMNENPSYVLIRELHQSLLK
jgi:hypothetical protein